MFFPLAGKRSWQQCPSFPDGRGEAPRQSNLHKVTEIEFRVCIASCLIWCRFLIPPFVYMFLVLRNKIKLPIRNMAEIFFKQYWCLSERRTLSKCVICEVVLVKDSSRTNSKAMWWYLPAFAEILSTFEQYLLLTEDAKTFSWLLGECLGLSTGGLLAGHSSFSL